MFFKTKEVKAEEEISEVKCEVCKHKIDRIDAQTVMCEYCFSSCGSRIIGDWIRDINAYFCPMHTVNYDIRRNRYGVTTYFKNIPATEQEVDKDGKPIKK